MLLRCYSASRVHSLLAGAVLLVACVPGFASDPWAKASKASAFDKVFLNPQPLPPRFVSPYWQYFKKVPPQPPLTLFKTGVSHSLSSLPKVAQPGSKVGLNPQPLPPRASFLRYHVFK